MREDAFRPSALVPLVVKWQRMRLDEKVALIAGAGGRQGTAIPIVFAREGAKVVLCGLDGPELERLCDRIVEAGGEAISRPTDLSVEEEAEAAVRLAVETYGRLDVLYNNTGIYIGWEHRTADTDARTWRALIATDLESHFLAAKHALREMARRRSGCVINVAAARAARLGGNVAYAAAKAGIIGMTKKMAREYAPFNVRVNCICPTNIQASPDAMSAPPPQPSLQRDGTPEDVAYAAVFLASDEAAWITGTELVVDGGAEVMD
jgi:NAD(P)-dependent dehydrogenase (short-subunit alcohol dehydrogenase family)